MASDVTHLKAQFESQASDDGSQESKSKAPMTSPKPRPSNSPTPPPRPGSAQSPTPPPKLESSKPPVSERMNSPSPTRSPALPNPRPNGTNPPTTALKPPPKSPKPPPRSKKVEEIRASLLQNPGGGPRGLLKGTELPGGVLRGASPPKSHAPSGSKPPVARRSGMMGEGATNAAVALARVLNTPPTGTKCGSSPSRAAPPVRSRSAKSSGIENRLQTDDRDKARSMETGLNRPAAQKLSPIRTALKIQDKARSLDAEQDGYLPGENTQRPKSAGITFKILQEDDFMSHPMRQRSSPIVSDSETPENSPAIARRRSRLKSALSDSYENALNDPLSSPYVPRANKTFSGSIESTDSLPNAGRLIGSPTKTGVYSSERSNKSRASSLPRDARSSVSPPPKALRAPENKLHSVSDAPPKPPVKPGTNPEEKSRASSLPRDVRSSVSPPPRPLQAPGNKLRSPPPKPPVKKPGAKPKPALKPKPPPKPPSLGNLKHNRGFSRPAVEKRRSQTSESSDERRSSSREATPDAQTPVVGPAAVRIVDTPEPAPGEGEAATSRAKVSSPEVVIEDEKGVRTEGLFPPTLSNEAHVNERRGNVDSGFVSEAPEDLVLARGREASIESNDPGPEDKPVAKETDIWDEARLEKARKKRQNIAMELLDTEKTYVGRLKVVAVDFYGAVTQFNERTRAIPDSDVQQIFLNTPQIYAFNKQLLEELQARMDMWSTKEALGDIICRLAPFLKLYSTYTAGFEDAMKKLTEWTSKDKKFDALVRETERALSTGLGVATYMLEPVQRIPRYRLLLRDYLKYLPVDADDRPATEKALGIISEAADRTNDRIKELENSNEILSIQRSIQDYEGTLLAPSRVFITNGILQKSSRKTFTPRMFFLFSDVLLHTVPSGHNIYKFKNEMPIFGMRVEEPKVSTIPFSFNVHSTTRSLILAANSEQEKQEWMDNLLLAINDDRKKRMSLRRESTTESEDADQEFGVKAPIMIPDKNVTMCQVCSSPFTFTFRRHHCRACGKVACGSCSTWKAFLPYMQKSERVCEDCYKLSRQASGEEEEEVDGPPSPRIAKKQEAKKQEGVLNLKAYDEEDTVIAGYVLCQEGRKWVRLWYQVKQDLVLYKFKAHEDIKAVNSMPLPGYIVTPDPEKRMINLGHVSRKKNLCDVFKIENAAEFDSWVSVLEKAARLELPTPISPRSSMDVDERLRSLSLRSASPEGPNPTVLDHYRASTITL